jgi:catalase
VTARLSNGSGDPRSRDGEPDVRGMAVSFHLPDGSRTDISAQTVPNFPVRTPDEFIELLRAAAPGRERLWRMPIFLARHPYALKTLRANAVGLKPPASYATRRYYAIHAFRWVGPDGERFVRYTWLPETGTENISTSDAKERGREYLQEEIAERLSRGPARFTLQLQIAGEGDSVDDPSAAWPDERETLDAGTLELTAVKEVEEPIVFDPARVTDGIELSEDPILNFRPRAYSVSVERRS